MKDKQKGTLKNMANQVRLLTRHLAEILKEKCSCFQEGLKYFGIIHAVSYYKYLSVVAFYSTTTRSRDSSVGIALGYGLNDRGSRVRFPAGAGNFSLHHRVQNGSGAHPASYPMGTRGSLPGDKAAGA
jgi:hypothetical protein